MKLSAIQFSLAVFLALTPAAPVWADGDSGASSGTPRSEAYTKALKAVEKEDYRAAVELLTTEVAENEGNADAFNMLGYSHRKTGNLDLALKFYLKALEINPEHRGAHEYIGETYLERHDLEKAKAHLAKLDDLCWLPCEQFTDLKEAIKRYETRKRS